MQTMTKHCDLSRVHAVGPCRGGTEIAFENGRTGFVPAGAAEKQRLAILAPTRHSSSPARTRPA